MSLEMLRREIETVTWRVLEAVASRGGGGGARTNRGGGRRGWERGARRTR